MIEFKSIKAFPNSRFEQFLVEHIADERLREFARVNWYDEYKPSISAEGTSVEDVQRMFDLLGWFEKTQL